MKYILFDESAVEYFVTTIEYQSTDYAQGKQLVDIILDNTCTELDPKKLCVIKQSRGLMFIGKNKSSKILVIDLTTCLLLNIEKNAPENILIVLQKTFRASMHFWNRQPFTNAERVNNSKLVVFPFPYNYNSRAANKRIVLEREPKSKRLTKRGINSPLLAYKYSDESVQDGSSESVNVGILDDAGEDYIAIKNSLRFITDETTKTAVNNETHAFEEVAISSNVDNVGFKYLNYATQYSKLTLKQKEVVDFQNDKVPLRITGAAGTGKTTSMLLRAYRLLTIAKSENRTYNIIFFAHSESTRYELEKSFQAIDYNNVFLNCESEQQIEFITLFSFCKRFRNIKDIQVLDEDATDAKEYQLLLIDTALTEIKKSDYKLYKPYLSPELRSVLEHNENYVLTTMLQHEFSIQIKGRADGVFDNYKILPSLKNGLPVADYSIIQESTNSHYKDKDFINRIFQSYQKMLEFNASYDVDDIVIEALLGLNAPIWRRKRATYGYDYIFVDEMHLFNLNEQNVFHYLTKDIDQEKIPICFAIDYSQAIGDRGDLNDSYIEKELSKDKGVEYNTVFRSTPQIINLCASIIASGALIFQTNFRNPYNTSPQNISTYKINSSDFFEPELIMYDNEVSMIKSIRDHCNNIIKNLQCKNYNIAIISFDESYIAHTENYRLISDSINRNIYLLNGRNISGLNEEVKQNNSIILTSPYNINGLEFDAVILLGIDGKRVPPTEGVSDIAKNFLKYKAYNMLYLSVSRAKYKVYMLGNQQYGESECLKHSLETRVLKRSNH